MLIKFSLLATLTNWILHIPLDTKAASAQNSTLQFMEKDDQPQASNKVFSFDLVISLCS
jgi:hypothetical protein